MLRKPFLSVTYHQGFALFLVALLALPAAAQEEIPLWPGIAPGTENWVIPETVSTASNGDRIVANVSQPTLTPFLPDPAIANGTAVIIAPGGALRILGIDNGGTLVAKWLNERGIAAFVLKYRTLQVDPDTPPPAPPANPGARRELDIVNANANPAPDNAALAEVLDMAVADTLRAMALVRARADDWRIDPDRVGLMGFSAGGGVIIGAMLAFGEADMPAFMASLYGPALQDVFLPDFAPPLFIAVGNQHFNVTNGCLALFTTWKAAGIPAELHIYDHVSGGFGMHPTGLPVDGWIERFHEWLVARDLVEQREVH